MYRKTIICLANSRKPSGRCIAGKEFDGQVFGRWLRPVSTRPTHEVSDRERRYGNGKVAQLLDIMKVPLNRADPFDHQVENHVLDGICCWTKIGTGNWDQVVSCVDSFDLAFWRNSESTRHGKNDKVSVANVKMAGSSLKLIRVSDLNLVVHFEPGYQGAPGRRRVRGRFSLNNTSYQMSVSDPDIEDLYLSGGDGTHPVGDAVLCVSLVEVYHGFAFRVIASLITQQRCAYINGN